MSGHSKWETTKHRRAALDAERAQVPFPAADTEYEVEILRRRIKVMRDLFWQIYVLSGSDTDMDDPEGPCPPEGAYIPDVPELAVLAVQELRSYYEEALTEKGSENKTAFIQRIP